MLEYIKKFSKDLHYFNLLAHKMDGACLGLCMLSYLQNLVCIRKTSGNCGFTLVELSIVIVIIGIISGGILLGRDLIMAAEIRAQISQIEQYNVAANTFRIKYGYFPGDIPEQTAIDSGLLRVGTGCHTDPDNCGDGNGRIGLVEYSPVTEERLFWLDLSVAGLVSGSFTEYFDKNSSTVTDGTKISDFLPPAKIGGINYVYVFNSTGIITGVQSELGPVLPPGGNYLGVVGVKRYCGYNPCGTWGTPDDTVTAMSVLSAYNIDQKIDDGLPMKGVVRAVGYLYLSGNGGAVVWADGNYAWNENGYGQGHGGGYGWEWENYPATAKSCFDNNNNAAAAVYNYSKGYNGGSGLNCALSFKMK